MPARVGLKLFSQSLIGNPFYQWRTEAGHRIRRARDRRLPKVEEDRVLCVIAKPDADFLGIRRDRESVAEIATQIRRNADLPWVDLAVAIDQAERWVGGRDRDPVAARQNTFNRVIAERQGNAKPFAVGIESHERPLPGAFAQNSSDTTGNEMGAIAAPGDFGEIAVFEALDIRIEAEL